MTEPPTPATTPVPETLPTLDGGAGRVLTEMRHSLFGSLQPPRWPTVIRVLLVELVVAAICWYFGADVWHSILFGTVLTTVGLVGSIRRSVPDRGGTGWRGGEGRNRDGARNDVSELSWTLRTNYGRVGNTALWRVQRLAQHRLATLRLDLREPADRPRIEQLIGRRAYVVLAPSARRPPYLRSLLHCLDVLDALAPHGPPGQR